MSTSKHEPAQTQATAPLSPEDLSPQQRADMAAALAHTEPATGEHVRQALSDALSIRGHSYQPLVYERLRRAEVRLPAIVRRLLDAEAEIERLTAIEANARKLVSAWLRASAEHVSVSHLDAVRDTPLIAGMQDGRANQYSDCANELRDVLDGEDPDGFEFGVSIEVTTTTDGAS